MPATTPPRTNPSVEHEPVFTLGQAGKPEHVLMPGCILCSMSIAVAPGAPTTVRASSVAYPLLDLKRLKIGVRDYVQDRAGGHRHPRRMEHRGCTQDGAPGVYVATVPRSPRSASACAAAAVSMAGLQHRRRDAPSLPAHQLLRLPRACRRWRMTDPADRPRWRRCGRCCWRSWRGSPVGCSCERSRRCAGGRRPEPASAIIPP